MLHPAKCLFTKKLESNQSKQLRNAKMTAARTINKMEDERKIELTLKAKSSEFKEPGNQ